MGIKIVSDSSSNAFEYANVDYTTVPLRIVTDNKEYVDNVELDLKGMIQDLKAYKGRSGTACPGQGEWLEAFGDAEQIICITITSQLSGSYNAARLAKEEYEETYPGRKVYVVDSLSTGAESKLHIEKMIELDAAGVPFEEICKQVEEYKENHTQLIFSLECLNNLANNGRVNSAVAKIAGVLGIRMVGTADGGVLNPLAKCRGEKGAIKEIMKIAKERGYHGGKFIIDNCYNEEMANKVKELVLADYPDAEVRIEPMTALCSFYAELGGLIIGYEV